AAEDAIRCAGASCGRNTGKGDANKILLSRDPEWQSAHARHVPGHTPLDGRAHRFDIPDVVVVPPPSKIAPPAPAESRTLYRWRLRSRGIAFGRALSRVRGNSRSRADRRISEPMQWIGVAPAQMNTIFAQKYHSADGHGPACAGEHVGRLLPAEV